MISPSRTATDGKSKPQDGSGSVPYPPLWNNFITIGGMILAAFSVILLLTFGLFSIVSRDTNPYVDIVGYMLLPGLLVIALIVMPLGVLLKSWRLRRKNKDHPLTFRFRMDLADPMQRRVAKTVVIGTFIFLPVVGVSSYHAYHFTDSTEFCAEACHKVMAPQGTTYQSSSHARVACAECHIGEGAGWFVKSKLSGTRQVIAMWRESYSRPIPPAIHHLRPARETCEHCHWPQRFYGAQLEEIPHYAADEQNTRRNVQMLLKIGGGHAETGPIQGIHWHMALANQIEYVASDPELQQIPWMKIRDPAGREKVYRSDGLKATDPVPVGQVRRLDCMDCHNRTAHEFLSPQEVVDRLLDTGLLDPALPFIKREAVRALVEQYPDTDTALQRIETHLTDYYAKEHPDTWRDRQASVTEAVVKIGEAYRKNFFPYMRVDWRTYPNNVGHMYSAGCFRCHDGKHVADDGTVVSNNCTSCHTFLHEEQKEGGSMLTEGDYVHAMELVGTHATLRCDQCHSGAVSPPPTCDGCHAAEEAFYAGASGEFSSFEIAPDPMHGTVDCEACHDASKPLDFTAMNATCMDCHDDEPEKYDGLVVKWKKEVDELLLTLADQPGANVDLLNRLRSAGPLHNIEATRKILKALAVERGAPSAAPLGPGS